MAAKKSSIKKTRVVKKRVAVKLAPLDTSVKAYADAEKALATANANHDKAKAKTTHAAARAAAVKTPAAKDKAKATLQAAKAEEVTTAAAVKAAQAVVKVLARFDAKIKKAQTAVFNRELGKVVKALAKKGATKRKVRRKKAPVKPAV